MRRSEDRILTTHVGSLPRNPALSDLLIRDEAGETVDRAELSRQSERAVRHVVERQVASGVDIVSDGEQPRVGFQTYVAQRMRGFGGESARPRPRDYTDFPALAAQHRQRFPRRSKVSNAPQAITEVAYDDLAPAREECRMFRSALGGLPSAPADAFMTAASPGIIATTMLNAHYGSHEAYVFALARQMRKEYELIAREFVLQIDAPDLAMERTVLFQDKTAAEFLKIAETHVAALNEALAAIPRERVRLHCCWGNYDGPHIHDIPLSDVLPVLYQAKVGALSLEFANPRHQHEYAALKKAKLPPEFVLLPGVIDFDDELRRASGSRRQPDLRSRRCRRRPQPRHRVERLRLRNLRRLGAGRRRRGVGQAAELPRRRGHRDATPVGPGVGCAPSGAAYRQSAGRLLRGASRIFIGGPRRARHADVGHLVGRPGLRTALGAGRRTRGLPGLLLSTGAGHGDVVHLGRRPGFDAALGRRRRLRGRRDDASQRQGSEGCDCQD